MAKSSTSLKKPASPAQLPERPQLDALAQYLGGSQSEVPADTLLSILCVARIQRIAARITAAQEQAAQHFGLSSGDAYTLYLLQRVPGRAARPSDLAKALSMTTGGMTKRLDRLESAGCVARERDAHDRRGVMIRLTAEESKTANSLRALYRKRQKTDLSSSLKADEWTQLADLLLKMEVVLAA